MALTPGTRLGPYEITANIGDAPRGRGSEASLSKRPRRPEERGL